MAFTIFFYALFSIIQFDVKILGKKNFWSNSGPGPDPVIVSARYA